jgi:hypothetical protein
MPITIFNGATVPDMASLEHLEQQEKWEHGKKTVVCPKCAYPHLEGQPCLCDLS